MLKSIVVQIQSHRDLVVWQKAKLLVVAIYRVSSRLPREETYGLISQMRRAAVSIPANLAEGHGRSTRRDYANFVGIAMGSTCELETLVELCGDLGYIAADDSAPLFASLNEIGRMLMSLRTRLAPH